MLKRYLLLSFCAGFCLSISAQSLHQQELLNHPDTGSTITPRPKPSSTKSTVGCELNKTVFGWHPYWMNGAEANYDWDLLSDLCYFSYEVNASTGNATSTHGFSTNDAVDTALAHGTNVHLCVTLFSSHATFFGSSTAQNTLISNLVTLIQNRGAKGINIDFEGLPSSQSANFTAFMIQLGNAMHTANPNFELSMCLYAVDWSNVFDEISLNTVVDFYTIMGYDYYYSGSSTAGPTDPLYGFSSGYDYCLSRSVSYYLNAGIPANKLVMAIPYYGREWETDSDAIPSSTTGNNVYSRTFDVVNTNTSGNYSNPIINTRSASKTYVFQNAGTWRQCWISEADELKERYDLVNRRGLRGIGIWALGYDDGSTEFWDAIDEKLTTCNQWSCSDTLYDEGGPEVNYYNSELVQYTISPPNATSIDVNFLEFATEANYDTLWLYDGASTGSPLIGFYSGTVGPGAFTTTSGMLTLRFKSDGSTRATGWKLAYSCNETPVEVEVPTTQIIATNPWQTTDFTTHFDDYSSQGIAQRFWNTQSLANDEWQSNNVLGHAYDGFNAQGNWTVQTGNWEVNSGMIQQLDESLANTNLALTLPLASADSYLYHWKGSVLGAGTNRRAGFHFMCDDLTLPNRGNSYFIWLRVDTDVIQVYEVTGDVFALTASFPVVFEPNTVYDSKTIYNLNTGEIQVFINDLFIGSWIDATPLTVSNGISFRSGNAQFYVDECTVYEKRTEDEMASVGIAGHFYTCNPSVSTSAGKIASLVLDSLKTIGMNQSLFDVDFTLPIVSIPSEEIIDTDTLLNTMSLNLANLIAVDINSAIANATFRVEKLDGSAIVLAETPISTSSFFAALTGLQSGENYRIKVVAQNGAGLSDTTFSDGFVYISTASISDIDQDFIQIYPNPASNSTTIVVPKKGKIRVYNSIGEVMLERNAEVGKNQIDCSDFASGIYFVSYENQLMQLVVE